MLGFPLLIIPFAIYNMIVFIVPMDWGTKLYTLNLKSGVAWTATLGDAFLAFSLLMLMFEFIKATNYGKSIVEHFLSIVLAGAVAAEFVMVDKAGTSIFAVFVVICFVDMFAGFAASLRRRRKAYVTETPAPVPVPYPQPVPRAEPAPVVPPPPRVESVPTAPPRTEPPVVKIDPVQKIEP